MKTSKTIELIEVFWLVLDSSGIISLRWFYVVVGWVYSRSSWFYVVLVGSMWLWVGSCWFYVVVGRF